MKPARRSTGFLVNGYPDGELANEMTERHARRAAARERWYRMQTRKRERHAREMAMAKLKDIEPLEILDCTYAAQDLFNAIPRLSAKDQATIVDYVEMRLEIWRKENCPPEAEPK